MTEPEGRFVDIGDVRLWVVERGPQDGYPIVVLHGGPGMDHHMFGDYLDPLTEHGYRLVLVDQRGQGRSDAGDPSRWTLLNMSEDVVSLARAMGWTGYAVLGHSYGAFVALQNAVDFPGMASQTIVSSGLPSSSYLEEVWRNLEAFEPVELRERVTSSWEREPHARTQEDVAALMHDQMPFQFGDPLDPRIEEYERRTADAVYAPTVLRHFAANEYGGIDVEDLLEDVRHPVLVLGGRRDRTCSPRGVQAIADGIPGAEVVFFEDSGHMTFVEANEDYLAAVLDFLGRVRTRAATS
jgi:proline iminopeptidase